MKKKIIVILCICIFIVLCFAFITVILDKKPASNEISNSREENKIMYYGKRICDKKETNEEGYTSTSEEVIYYDSNYAILEIESIIKYYADDYSKYEELKNDFENCKDNYTESKEIICNIESTYEDDNTPINTWATHYFESLVNNGYTCN